VPMILSVFFVVLTCVSTHDNSHTHILTIWCVAFLVLFVLRCAPMISLCALSVYLHHFCVTFTIFVWPGNWKDREVYATAFIRGQKKNCLCILYIYILCPFLFVCPLIVVAHLSIFVCLVGGNWKRTEGCMQPRAL